MEVGKKKNVHPGSEFFSSRILEVVFLTIYVIAAWSALWVLGILLLMGPVVGPRECMPYSAHIVLFEASRGTQSFF